MVDRFGFEENKSRKERERERERERARSLPLWIDGGSVVLHRRKWRNRASRGKERGALTLEDCREKEREKRKWCRPIDVQGRGSF